MTAPVRKINHQSNMQHQSANRSALADRPIAIRPRPPAAQVQFGRILDHDNVASRHPRAAVLAGRLAHHRAGRHRFIAQKTRKLHLARSAAAEPPNACRAPLKQGLVQQGPPFSRRRSPNHPKPNSIVIPNPANHPMDPRNQSPHIAATTMCAFDSPERGRTGGGRARIEPLCEKTHTVIKEDCAELRDSAVAIERETQAVKTSCPPPFQGPFQGEEPDRPGLVFCQRTAQRRAIRPSESAGCESRS